MHLESWQEKLLHRCHETGHIIFVCHRQEDFSISKILHLEISGPAKTQTVLITQIIIALQVYNSYVLT